MKVTLVKFGATEFSGFEKKKTFSLSFWNIRRPESYLPNKNICHTIGEEFFWALVLTFHLTFVS